ncbi:hypothetical protein ACFX2G_035057 [Malus domestica]
MSSDSRCFVDQVYPRCPMIIDEVIMPANLMMLDIMDFDVILGTDWLHYNHAKIDCYGKTVTLPIVRSHITQRSDLYMYILIPT